MILISSLVLASIFVLSFLKFNIQLWSANDDRSRLLAEHALRAARNSVHEAVHSVLETNHDEPHKQIALDRGLDTKLGRLQSSLDNFYPQWPTFRDIALEEPSSTQSSYYGRRSANIHYVDMCETLAGKRISMIGGEHIYRLHLLLLQHRERAENKSFPCLYHEFCTHHHICLPDQHLRVNTSLPRYIKPPTAQELIDFESAVVNYIVSDTLRATRDESSWEYTSPFIDSTTGVRLRETYWLPAARKANVVILGRGPLSAPGQTYTGDWSFLCRVPDYLAKSLSVFANRDGPCNDDQAAPRSLDILNSAVHLTVSRFLPDIFQFLQSIIREVRPSRQKRLIWPSSWYRLPGRGVARTALLRDRIRSWAQDMLPHSSVSRSPESLTEHAFLLQLSTLLDADAMNTVLLEDPWTLLFNAQVYLQNVLLRELLPRYGIVFLPLNVPWLDGNQAHERTDKSTHGTTMGLDLERTAAIGKAFSLGLDHILRYLE